MGIEADGDRRFNRPTHVACVSRSAPAQSEIRGGLGTRLCEMIRSAVKGSLAYSEGHQLTDCLDLLRAPAEHLWVEWADGARRDEFLRAKPDDSSHGADADVLRAGVLIRASRSDRSGVMKTFWTTRDRPGDPLVAALETHFDFDGNLQATHEPSSLLDGALAGVPSASPAGRDAIQTCVRYRFDRTWLQYYRHCSLSSEERTRVVRDSLATVANDLPVVLALSLLLVAHGGIATTPSSLARLNAKRQRLGRAPLLEHLEVSAPVFSDAPSLGEAAAGTWRRAPRLHHVRGHLVRRANIIYWRAPHWRGHVRLGRVKTRTVALKLARTRGREERNDRGTGATWEEAPIQSS